MKVASILGTRPQFIKAAALSPELRKNVEEVLIHTGQHYDKELSETFFDVLKIPEPDYNLGIGSDSHSQQTGRMLMAVEKVLLKERPNLVLVYGDTNSTLAGALAAAMLQMPIGHVEAGLRSYNRSMPEEVNRVMVDHLSTILFAPTVTSVENLRKEGIVEGVHLTGDVMFDLATRILSDSQYNKMLDKYHIKSKNYVLATVHRPANTDNEQNMRNILDAFQESGKHVIFPIHPRTRKAIDKYGLDPPQSGNVNLMKPLDYLEFIGLLKNAEKVVTDSGGVQKEAYFLGVPCVTLRDETEWPETVKTGWNVLVGSKKSTILKGILEHKTKGDAPSGFGDGHAAKKIADLVTRMGGTD